MNLVSRTILLIGGTGSFGSNLLPKLASDLLTKIRIYSRDEYKQSILRQKCDGANFSWFIGDVRDRERLRRAMEGVDIVIHAAALKQVQSCEYNPNETIKTNIQGSVNVIDCALDCNVAKVLAISTDKAVQPINLYGATKMCMEHNITQANSYRGSNKRTKFSCVRYGNVSGSRGSVVQVWREALARKEVIRITDPQSTRFWMTVAQANDFVLESLDLMEMLDGGEIFVPAIPSVRLIDLYRAMTDGLDEYEVIGTRVGDKIHETLVAAHEIGHTYRTGDRFIIYPDAPQWRYREKPGVHCAYADGYRSDNNEKFLTVDEIKKYLEKDR